MAKQIIMVAGKTTLTFDMQIKPVPKANTPCYASTSFKAKYEFNLPTSFRKVFETVEGSKQRFIDTAQKLFLLLFSNTAALAVQIGSKNTNIVTLEMSERYPRLVAYQDLVTLNKLLLQKEKEIKLHCAKIWEIPSHYWEARKAPVK